MTAPNYMDINIPDKDREEYSYSQRRAAILQLIMKKGDPSALPSTRALGEQFDVSHTTIKKDIDTLKDYLSENLGKDVKPRLRTLLDKAVKQKRENKDWEEAFRLMKEFSEFLFDEGSIDKTPEQVEMQGVSTEEVVSSVQENLEKAEEVRDNA